jgi:hypothetical protein
VATGKSPSFVNHAMCTSYRAIYPIMRPSILAALGFDGASTKYLLTESDY